MVRTGIVGGVRLGRCCFRAEALGMMVRSRTCTSEGGDDRGDGVRVALRLHETHTLLRSPGMLVRR